MTKTTFGEQNFDDVIFLKGLIQGAAAIGGDLIYLASIVTDPLIVSDEILTNIACAIGSSLTPDQMREIAAHIFPSE